MSKGALARGCILAGTMVAAASAAVAGPVNYSLLTTIAIPTTPSNVQPGGALTSFDISFADSTGFYYLADRSNASVDIINGATNQVVTQVGGFAGQQATTSTSGPDGILVAHTGTSTILFAGDANSTLRSFNVANPAAPTAGFAPLNTGGTFRVDEMAFSPTANLVLAANNADSPAFATLVNATTGAIVHGNITIPNSPVSGGLEQSVWSPSTGTFFVSVPAFNGSNNPGGVAEISTAGVVLRTFDFGLMGIASCSPTGLAVGASGRLMVGCGNAKTQTIVLDPAANGGAGAIVDTIPFVAGSDELWYDPTSGDYFVTGTDASGANRIFAVISDATDTVLETVALPNVNAHSIAVDPLNGEVFVPLEGGPTDSLCALGCVAVFAQTAVPEAGTLPLLAVGLFSLAGASIFRRRLSATSPSGERGLLGEA